MFKGGCISSSESTLAKTPFFVLEITCYCSSMDLSFVHPSLFLDFNWSVFEDQT